MKLGGTSAWVVYIGLLLLSILFRLVLNNRAFAGEQIALRPGAPIAAFPQSKTHHMMVENDGNLVLRKGKPGDTTGAPIWESGRPYPDKNCRKCTAMLDNTGERLVVKDGRKVVKDFNISEDRVLKAAIKVL